MNKIRRDLILALVFLILGIVGFTVLNKFGKKGVAVSGYEDGKKVFQCSLEQEGIYEIKTQSGSNTLVVEDGYVYMKDADCPDKLCVNMGKISKSGQTIVCLPHKLIVKIENEEETDIDVR